MKLTVSQADAYFTTHLDRDNWSGQDDACRLAALAMAADDIAARLGIPEIDAAKSDQCHAVFEQAVFLSRHYDRLSRAAGEVAAESINDAGSRSYRPQPHPGISPRAMALIRRIVGRGLTRG